MYSSAWRLIVVLAAVQKRQKQRQSKSELRKAAQVAVPNACRKIDSTMTRKAVITARSGL
jgi:hypothetical protein